MKFLHTNRVGLLSLVVASFCAVIARPAASQECPLSLPASPGNDLTSFITIYPYYSGSSPAGVQQQLISYFFVDVTNQVNGTNYLNPPIPYGLYPAWCVDEWDDISPAQITVPGSLYTGALYSTCDPNLNSELPPGHPNTLVSSTNWQMVNYILNHQAYGGSNAFYWDVQAAINTLVGSGVGSAGFCGVTLTTPIPQGSDPDGSCGYSTYDPVVVQALLTAASNNAASWKPQCGDVYGAIYVTDPLSANAQFLMLEVPIVCAPVSANCVTINAVKGVAIAPVTLTGIGGVGGPYTFSATNLPTGLTISSSGTISGTPTVSGTFGYSVTITDAAGDKGSMGCSVTVGAPPPPSGLGAGDTATIGFWHNKNGQALIDSLNGGPTSTALGNWLASNFPYLYGNKSANNMTGKPNTTVAALFLTFFGAGGRKTQAQILSAALASYVTDSALAGTGAGKYGFNISAAGTGAKTYNVQSDGAGIGLSNNASYTVMQLLLQANLDAKNGTFNADANSLNDIFSNINQNGDIQ